MSSPNDIFVSYVSADREVAQGLCEDLTTQGYTVWWDRDLVAGEAFAKAIDEQLVTAKSVIVLWSRESLKSRWVAGEAETAASLNKLIPVLLDGIGPAQLPSAGLRALQCIRYGDNRGLQAALDAVLARPTSQVSLASALSARMSRSYRRVARAITPLRVGLLVVVIALLIRTVSDLQAWHAIEHSTAAADYQIFVASRAALPNSLFPSSQFLMRLANQRLVGKEKFEQLEVSGTKADFEDFVKENPDSMYASYARIRLSRIKRVESGAYVPVLKDSNLVRVAPEQVAALDCDRLWRARNEIFFSLGYCFTTKDAVAQFRTDADCPEQCTARRAVNRHVNNIWRKVETANIEAIKAQESKLGCRQAKSIPDC